MTRRAPHARAALNRKLISFAVASCFAAEFAHANPTGPSVAAGAAAFNTVGKTLTVTNTPNAIINWQGFSIGAGEATRFQQQGASSAVLNRVVGQDPSAILGTLWSNGKVFLVNPNGVLFGQGSRIDVAGLVASTLNITDRDFLAGRLNFQAGTVAGSIVNQGEIVSASGGRIFLIAPDIQNHGLISSPSGEVVLAAGKTVSLVDADVPNLKVEVQAGGEALNVGRILADGGKAGIYAGLITQRGIVRADSASKDATGKIVFKASDTTILDDGSVTSAAGAKGGEIQVLGNKVGLVGNARVDASGDAGGGTVLIGGDFQGKNPGVQNAARTYVGPDATIKADARAVGDGGKVVVWSDEVTGFYGNITARGGSQGGNGGFAEVSSKGTLDFFGLANLSAYKGKTGTLLLDPSNVTISDAVDSLFSGGFTNLLDNVFAGATSGATNIQWATIDLQLLLNNVVITTSGSGGSGNIVVAAAHSFITPNKFSLLAHNDITINGAITTAFGGDLAMYAGWDGANTNTPTVNGLAQGSIFVNQNLNAPNASIDLTAAKDIVVTSAQVNGGSSSQLTATKGDITLTNANVAGYPLALSAPVGTIAVNNSRVDGGNSGGAVSMNAANISILNSNGSNGVYAGGSEGSGTITMTSTNGITVNNSTIAADAGSSQNAIITLTAGGLITVTGASTIVANSSVDANVTLNGAAGVTVNGNSFVQAFGSNQASVELQAMNAGAAIDISNSEVTAKPPSSTNNVANVNMVAAGALSLTGAMIEAYSSGAASVSMQAGGTLTAGAGPSPMIEARGGTGATVSLLSTGGNVVIGGDILADTDGGTGSISVNATQGAITSTGGILSVTTGGSPFISLIARDGIGTQANPVRIQDFATLDATVNNTGTTGDIALSFVSGGVTVGPSDDFLGLLNNNPNGTYFLQAETGNLSLAIPFTPNGAALIAGQSVNLQATTGSASLISGSSIAATGAGNVTIYAGNTAPSGAPDGVLIDGGQITAQAGAISITGYGKIGKSADADFRHAGVKLINSAVVSTTTGAINITGYGGSFLSGVDGGDHGINMLGAATQISTVDGAITLVGQGGSLSNTPGIGDARGIRADNAIIQATGTGTIDLTGFGGNITGTSAQGLSGGIGFFGPITSHDGNIHVAGSGGSTGANSDPNTGTRGASAGPVESTGTGSITIIGQGGTSQSADFNVGVQAGALVRTASGSITIQGTGGSTSAAGGVNPGVNVFAPIQSTGGGSVIITGAAGSSADATSHQAIRLQSGANVSTVGGSIALTGTGNILIGEVGAGAQSVAISSGSGSLTINSSGHVSLNAVGGSVNVNGGSVSISAGGNLSMDAGSQVSGTDVTLLAKDMDIAGGVIATTSATLAPSDLVTDMLIQPCIGLGSGLLCLAPTEIQKVNAPLLTLGRSDSNTNIFYLGMALTSADYNVPSGTGLLRIRAAFIYESSPGLFGGPSSPFNHSLELRAGGNIDLFQHGIFLGDNNNLTILAAQDFAGNLNIGNVTLQVGTTAANTGSMMLQAQNINAIVSGGGSGGFIRVLGSGNQTIAATGNAIFSNDNVSTGSLLIQADGGTQSISATGIELTAGSGTNTSAQIVAGGSQSIAAGGGGLLLAGGIGTAANSNAQISASGTQAITVNGGGDIMLAGGSGSGNSNFARINANGTAQTIAFNSGGNLVLTGGTVGNLNFAEVRANNATVGAQTQTITGATGITVTGGASGGGVDPVNNNDLGNFARIRNVNGSQVISVGAGGITLTGGGGSLTDNFAFIQQGSSTGAPGTSQSVTVNNGGAITLQGGSTAQTNVINNPTSGFRGSYAQLQSNGDSQQIDFTNGGAINLTGGTVGSNNAAQILSRFGLQTISGAPAITLTGGASGGYVDIAANRNEGNFANLTSQAGQSITASAVTLKGGDAGVGNHAEIFNGSTTAAQTISAANISMMGGAGGGIDSGSTASAMGNYALIQSNVAAQTITATGMSLLGGAGGQENFSSVNAPTQDITVHGNLSLVGGGSVAGTLRGGGVRIGGRGGATPGPTDLMLTVDGDLTMTGGSAAYSGAVIGTGPLIQSAQPTSITMNVGGNVTLNPGTVTNSVVYIGSFPANVSGGDISIVAAGNVTLNGGTAIRTLGALDIDAGGALTLTGGSSGSGQSALILTGGDQTITANSITLNGGAAGGADLNGNFARIRSDSGVQTIITSGDMTLTAGAAGINNFAAIQAPTQNIIVQGNLSLIGGGSIASLDGTVGGGARIGGVGATSATNLALIVDGNVTMTGGSVANAGASIGSNLQGGQPTTITMDVGGNITLNPGTVALGGSRIGSPASNIAGGDIAITASGALALNSTGPGLGTAIRTLGNVTLDAASITQGPDSVIIAGGTTTIGGGTVSLPSATNQFGTVLLNTTGNVVITDADAIIFGTSTTGSGSLTVTAPGGITQSGPITTGAASFSAGASPIVLTNAGNDFTGPVDLDTSSSAAITDANAFIIQGGGGGGPSPTSLTINANGAVTQSAAFTGSAPAGIVINAGSGPITLNSTGNNFTGNTSVAANTTGAVSLTNGDAGGINLGASTVGGALSLTSGGPVTQSGPLAVSGASTINAGSNPITLTNASNDFVGTVNFTGSNVSITDANAIAIGSPNASGALNIVATSTSFLNGFSANNYSFSGGTYTLAAGTYNLGGATTVASGATVTASGATINGAGGTLDVAGTFNASSGTVTTGTMNVTGSFNASGATLNAGTTNVSGSFNTAGGTLNIGTLNLGAGGTLSGTGTIQGNVNNLAGTVSPGASPGMLTITGNYTQGASGTLDMQIGGLVAGTDYDQLRVGGATSLAGTLNTELINGFVPLPGSSFVLIDSTGPVSGTFTTVNQPVGALFNNFYGPTTFEFIAAGSAALPPPLVAAVNNTITSTAQLNQPVIEVLDKIFVSPFVPATTTTPEGKIVPKPPACN